MIVETFHGRFKKFIILCCCCGVYFPGVENLHRFLSLKLVTTYLIVFHLVGWINVVDNIVSTYLTLGTTGCIPLLATNGVVLWVFLTSTSVYMQRKSFRRMFQLWNEELKPEFYSKERKEILDEQTYLVWRKLKNLTLFAMAPLFAFYVNSVVQCQLFLPTYFELDYENKKGPRTVVIIKAFSYVAWMTNYGFNQCSFTMILRLVMTEFKYLCYALDKTLNDMVVNDDGSYYYKIQSVDSEDVNEYARKEVMVKLKAFVKYHQKVIEFCNIVKKIYTGLVFFELSILTSFLCFSIIAGMGGYLKPDVAFVLVTSMTCHCFMTSLLCKIGDEIRDLNIHLRDIAFHGNWMAYPPPVRKFLTIIMVVAREKPFTIIPFGLYPLLMHTFGSMTYLQYQVMAFLYDMLM